MDSFPPRAKLPRTHSPPLTAKLLHMANLPLTVDLIITLILPPTPSKAPMLNTARMLSLLALSGMSLLLNPGTTPSRLGLSSPYVASIVVALVMVSL